MANMSKATIEGLVKAWSVIQPGAELAIWQGWTVEEEETWSVKIHSGSVHVYINERCRTLSEAVEQAWAKTIAKIDEQLTASRRLREEGEKHDARLQQLLEHG